MAIIFKYSLFAILSIIINLITQWFFFHFFQGFWDIYVAMAAGTLTGLMTKYTLDRRWIFYYQPCNRHDNTAKFLLYSLMGVITTIIFWGTETAFFYLFEFSGSQYVGGGVGLTIGYTSKYFLDKRFVFRTQACRFQDGAATQS